MSTYTIAGLELAPQVAREYAESKLAVVDANVAAGELLDLVVAQVLPAIDAMGSAIATGFDGKSQTYRPGPRGLRLAGHNGPRASNADSPTGQWQGSDVFLLVDGVWLELKYEGEWSRNSEGRERSHWSARETTLTSVEVATRYPLATLVESIVVALAKAVGSREAATKKYVARAERLRALATLLK